MIYAAGVTYQIESRSDGYWLDQVDFNRLPGCGTEPVAGEGFQTHRATCSASSSNSVINLLALYTKKTRQQQGGQNKIENKIQNAVDWANDAFSNSEVNVRFEVARFEEVDLWDHGGDNDGSTQVLYGSASGISATDQVWHQGKAGVAGSPEGNDLFGTALATGDFDGDGYEDLAAGVPGEDIDGKDDAGMVNVLYGSQGRLSADGDQSWHQETTGVLGTGEKSVLAPGHFRDQRNG